MTYSLPPLNALRAFEAAARHLSFKLAAHELHVTPAAVGQQVKALEARLGVRLFERLHKQLILTAAGQAYLPGISDGFRCIADATSQLKPAGAVLLQLGVHGSLDLRRLALAEFRGAHADIGLRVLQPAGLHELVEGKVDLLIARGLGHHPGYRCDRINEGSGLGEWLIAPEGTADCPEIVSFREWLRALANEAPLANRNRPRKLRRRRSRRIARRAKHPAGITSWPVNPPPQTYSTLPKFGFIVHIGHPGPRQGADRDRHEPRAGQRWTRRRRARAALQGGKP
jgi:DNA-binding transcriptional LysR family regulator